jgi:hypothetical protein
MSEKKEGRSGLLVDWIGLDGFALDEFAINNRSNNLFVF